MREPMLPNLPYSPEQLFWISFGQTWCEKWTEQGLRSYWRGYHPLGEFRTNGMVANSEDFARDFGCPLGSPMNPVDKCEVWGF